MTNPTSNYGFVLPNSADLVTDLPADFDVALQGVDTRLKALQPGTTLGDVAYSSATANTNTRLGIGSTGQVLTVAAGVPTWATAASATSVGCAIFQNNVNATLGTTAAIIPFASETFDSNNFHSTTVNTSRITIPTGMGGNYKITVSFKVNVSGTYGIIRLLKNGTSIASEGIDGGQISRIAGSNPVLSGSVILPLVATDYIEISYENSETAATYSVYAQFSAIMIP